MNDLWSAAIHRRFAAALRPFPQKRSFAQQGKIAKVSFGRIESGDKSPQSKWRAVASAVALALISLCGCQQKMANQPSYKPLDPSDFFSDGRSARPLVPGTVARGYLKADVAFWTGRRAEPDEDQDPNTGLSPADMKATLQPKEPTGPGQQAPPIDEKKLYARFVDEFPIPVDEQVVEHGYHRFMIYCVVCHDPLGTGNGKIVERGYTRPPSYHIERLRRAPVGHLFAVISEGYGSMPSYANQIPVRDRWAIVAYIRALQASQHAPAAGQPQLPAHEQPPAAAQRSGEQPAKTPANLEQAAKERPSANRLPATTPKPNEEPREQRPQNQPPSPPMKQGAPSP